MDRGGGEGVLRAVRAFSGAGVGAAGVRERLDDWRGWGVGWGFWAEGCLGVDSVGDGRLGVGL